MVLGDVDFAGGSGVADVQGRDFSMNLRAATAMLQNRFYSSGSL